MNPYTVKSIVDYKIKKDKPWLVLGKGPSFSKVWNIVLNDYYVFSLNHAGQLVNSDICHVIDIAGIPNDTTRISSLFIPLYPHVDFKPTNFSIDSPINTYGIKFEGSIYSYNLSTHKGMRNKRYPTINARFFSVEAAFNILSLLSINTIYTLGIDGGNKYADEFYDIGLKPLENGRKTFDDGIGELNNICSAKRLRWIKL